MFREEKTNPRNKQDRTENQHERQAKNSRENEAQPVTPFKFTKSHSETPYGLFYEIRSASDLRGLRAVFVFPRIRPSVTDVQFAHFN